MSGTPAPSPTNTFAEILKIPDAVADLVHAALVEYPRYVSRHSGWFITPEQAIDELVAWREGPPERRTLVQGLFRYWGRLRR